MPITATASYGTDRDWLLSFCPSHLSKSLAALFEIEHQVVTSLRAGLDHAVAHTRLEWWSEELTRLSQGSPRHPLTRELASFAITRGVTPPDLTALIEHVRVDLACVAFFDQNELDLHFASWARSLFRTATLLEYDMTSPKERAAAEKFAGDAGSLVRELELLRRFSEHAIAGRIYVPLGNPPSLHAPWSAQPLGENEVRTLDDRRQTLRRRLRVIAAEVAPQQRSALRVPLLWISFSMNSDRDDSALLAPLRRTIRAWCSAFTLSRGRLPSALSFRPRNE
ncbi:MAG: hypothetical protein FJ196_05775 [Gammaproteobacteria bacterium]|nr:hypothetical protein [Gammaproteobacteria bacterium]